jgi:2-succinyl-6-hydroxy-2,4-cyclohexadiene-1-carboxylate synthase
LGARLALGISRRRLDLAGLVLVSGHPGLDDSSSRGDRALEDAKRARSLESTGLPVFADAWGREPIVQLFAASERDRAARAEARRDHTVAGIAWSLRATGLGAMPPLDGVLGTRPYPVRLVTGERDEKFTSLARARASSTVTVHVAPGAGHDVCLDAAPFVAAVLRGALA